MDLITALRITAARLRDGKRYQWGHFGMCNCGQLAQTLTRRSRAEIHQAALTRGGDWAERARDYCPTSGFPIDEIIYELVAHGLTADDLVHLENLSDPKILRQLPLGRRHLRRNVRQDVVTYLEAWAKQLESNRLSERAAAEQFAVA